MQKVIHFSKVLLAEDDDISVMIVTRLMEMNDFADQIISADTGLAACNILKKNMLEKTPLPDIILLDLRMGIMDGWDFLDWYVEFTKKLISWPPVYILSSTVDEKDKIKAATYNEVKGFFSKPLNNANLQNIISDNL